MNKIAFNPERYIEAQEKMYASALSEIRAGKKISHWMWYIFPQIAGLGLSSMSRYYALKSLEEAKAYLDHDILCPRLLQITGELLKLNTNNARYVFGWPDDLKLHSSMTLFAMAAGSEEENVFTKVLDKFFGGDYNYDTLRILEA